MLALRVFLDSHGGGLVGSCRALLAHGAGLCHDRAAGSTTARMLSGMAGQCLSPLGHNWPSSGVLQVLARAGRAQRLHGAGVGALQHVLIPQGEEEEAAGWADAEPAKHRSQHKHIRIRVKLISN